MNIEQLAQLLSQNYFAQLTAYAEISGSCCH